MIASACLGDRQPPSERIDAVKMIKRCARRSTGLHQNPMPLVLATAYDSMTPVWHQRSALARQAAGYSGRQPDEEEEA
jgi:hypothetical protein